MCRSANGMSLREKSDPVRSDTRARATLNLSRAADQLRAERCAPGASRARRRHRHESLRRTQDGSPPTFTVPVADDAAGVVLAPTQSGSHRTSHGSVRSAQADRLVHVSRQQVAHSPSGPVLRFTGPSWDARRTEDRLLIPRRPHEPTHLSACPQPSVGGLGPPCLPFFAGWPNATPPEQGLSSTHGDAGYPRR